MFLFLPYEILRHVRKVTTEKHIEEYAEEINSVYSKIIDILENAYNESKINGNEILTIMNMLNDTAEYKLKDYPQIWKGVNEMLNREYVPRWKIELEQEKEKNTKEVTLREAIDTIQFMKNEGIPETSIRKYAKQKKVSMKTVDGILGSSKGKKAVQI